jgi:hypothetical protein
MRNEKSFALPVEFTWKRARAGYQWSDTRRGRILYAVDALKPDWQNTFERYETTYRPLEERTGLFREFAALEPSAYWVPVATLSSNPRTVLRPYTLNLLSFGRTKSRLSNSRYTRGMP